MPLTIAYHFAYKAGDNVEIEFAVTDEHDAVANITGYLPHFAAGHTKDTPVLSTEVSPKTATATITNAAGGLFRVLAGPADTAALLGTYPFDAELRSGVGDRVTVTHGYLTFVADLV